MIFGKFNPEKVRQTAPASHARCRSGKVKSVLKMRSAAEIGHFFETQCMYVCVSVWRNRESCRNGSTDVIRFKRC